MGGVRDFVDGPSARLARPAYLGSGRRAAIDSFGIGLRRAESRFSVDYREGSDGINFEYKV